MGYRPSKVLICMDNQASIYIIDNPSINLDQHIVQKVEEEIDKLKKDGYII